MSTGIATNTPEALLHAFAQTDYRVRLDSGDWIVRVGRRHAWLDRALGGRAWTIITACNPGGRRGDDETNIRRHHRLIEHAAGAGFEAWPALNRDPTGHWPDEPGLLIAALDAAERVGLARKFGQAAVVFGIGGDIARLELHGPDWPHALPDWALKAR